MYIYINLHMNHQATHDGNTTHLIIHQIAHDIGASILPSHPSKSPPCT